MQQKELSCIKAENIQSSPFAYILKIIGGKYKWEFYMPSQCGARSIALSAMNRYI